MEVLYGRIQSKAQFSRPPGHRPGNYKLVRRKFFGDGEIKSKNVGSNDDRRIEILTELIKLPIKVFSIVIDKAEILPTSGLIYKRPFIKYINGILYRKLYKTFPSIVIYADEQGNKEFQESFVNYIHTHHLSDLFWTSDLILKSSNDDVLIQVADFFAGSLARRLDRKKRSKKSDEIFNTLRKVLITLEIWPPGKFTYCYPEKNEDESVNVIIENYCITQARVFISENFDSEDEDVQLQIETLRYLLFRYSFDENYSYITTGEILSSINETRCEEVTVHQFRTKAIAKLRDSEVIIAGSNDGLKIPVTLADLQEHVKQTNGKVMPQIDRIIRAREQILLLTKNEIDLFKEDLYRPYRILSEKIGT
jgi:hypothetical protein